MRALMLLCALGLDAHAADEKLLQWLSGLKGGGYTEFQPASPSDGPERFEFDHWKANSPFLSLEAMTFLELPFAKAHPKFNLYMPMLMTPEELVVLRTTLAAFKQDWLALASNAAAQHKWAVYSQYIRDVKSDAEWKRLQKTFAHTIDQLSAFVQGYIQKKQRLWVLGV